LGHGLIAPALQLSVATLIDDARRSERSDEPGRPIVIVLDSLCSRPAEGKAGRGGLIRGWLHSEPTVLQFWFPDEWVQVPKGKTQLTDRPAAAHNSDGDRGKVAKEGLPALESRRSRWSTARYGV